MGRDPEDAEEAAGQRADTAASGTPRRSRLGGAVLYPNVYVWYVFFAKLDILITYLIIHPDAFGSDLLAEIFADDPAADEDLHRWAKRTETEVLDFTNEEGILTFVFRKKK